MVCMSYFIFVMPISLLNILDSKVWFPASHVIAFCIYWSQYSLNCLVYAVRSDQYRKAYASFLMMVFGAVKRFYVRFKRCFTKRKVTNTTAFLYIERSVFPSPLQSMCLETREIETISRNKIIHSAPSLSVSGIIQYRIKSIIMLYFIISIMHVDLIISNIYNY